jgi:TonB family protein
MLNTGLSRNPLSLLALAALCLSGSSTAEAQVSDSSKSPVVIDHKRAAEMIVDQVKPEYPPLAKLNYIQGPVRVELKVSSKGRVARAHILSGHPLLAAAALEAIHQWVYRPLMTSSGAESFLTTVEVNFSLQARKIRDLPARPVRDFNRQVKPPAVVARPSEASSDSLMRLRLLLDDEGHVIDIDPLSGPPDDLNVAQRLLDHWAFRPAHWGTIAIPWYIEVEVPMADPPVHQSAADSARP